jgi:hypothetical protein
VFYRFRIIPESLDGDRKWVTEYSKSVEEATQAAYRKHKQGLIDEISAYPRKRSGPVRWKSNAQRIAVMAKLRAEGNLPYRRSGQFGRNWSFDLKRMNDEMLMTLVNKSYFAAFVVGEFTRTPSILQQPFHQDTGWLIAEKLRRKWFERIKTDINSSLLDKIGRTRVRYRKKRKDAR